MSITGVNSYTTSAASSKTGTTTSKTSLTMDDFFTLLSAQMQNQDMFNPMQDTEFIGQMAQFSTLQQMQELSSDFKAATAVSYLGKYAVAQTADDSGSITQAEGIVESVDFSGDTPMLLIDGQWFETGSVTEVLSQAPAAETAASGEDASTAGTETTADNAAVSVTENTAAGVE